MGHSSCLFLSSVSRVGEGDWKWIHHTFYEPIKIPAICITGFYNAASSQLPSICNHYLLLNIDIILINSKLTSSLVTIGNQLDTYTFLYCFSVLFILRIVFFATHIYYCYFSYIYNWDEVLKGMFFRNRHLQVGFMEIHRHISLEITLEKICSFQKITYYIF